MVIGQRKGFFAMWAMLFNALIAIYTSVMLSPVLIKVIPSLEADPYYHGLCVLAVAIFVFAVAQIFSVLYLMDSYSVPIPRIFNTFVAGVLGFLMGYFVANFIFFSISLTPLRETSTIKKMCGKVTLAQVVDSPVWAACNSIHRISFHWDRDACEDAVDLLQGRKIIPTEDPNDRPIDQ